jgi:peptide/nickel transport system substrate-binding protein
MKVNLTTRNNVRERFRVALAVLAIFSMMSAVPSISSAAQNPNKVKANSSCKKAGQKILQVKTDTQLICKKKKGKLIWASSKIKKVATNEIIRGGILKVGADLDPSGLDPTTTNAFASWDFTALMFNGLLRFDQTGKIQPDLAASYQQPSSTEYIFKLRSGVTFHNGKAFTAEDVKYTFDRRLDPKVGSPSRASFSSIDAVTVIDPLTVKFKLKNVDAAFLSFIANNPDGLIVPQGVENINTNPVGTGPFVFKSYTPNLDLQMVANKNYYEKGLPYLDGATFLFFKDASSLFAALRSKSIDMTWLKDPKVAKATADSDINLISAPGQYTRTLPVWLKNNEAPFDDLRVRQALSLATDRKTTADVVLAGTGKVTGAIPMSMIGGYTGDGSDLPNYKYDVEKAKKLLTAAGYPDGIDLGDYKVVAANPLDVQAAQLLKQQWEKAGIKVNIKPMEVPPLIADYVSGNFTILSVALAFSPDPDNIVNRMKSTTALGKAFGMSDKALDELITDARSEVDPKQRQVNYLEIQQMIARRAYVLHIYQYPLRWEMWRSNVQGYLPTPANSRQYLRTAWFSK